MNVRYLIALVAIIVAGVAYYGISPLFRNVEIHEEAPKTSTSTPMTDQNTAEVIGTDLYPASGTARIIEGEGKKYLRYENFKTINGPDLYVYLAKDLDAKEFVNLGEIKGTEGNINYEIPAGVNFAEYPYVLTWCKQFSVLFNYAKIN